MNLTTGDFISLTAIRVSKAATLTPPRPSVGMLFKNPTIAGVGLKQIVELTVSQGLQPTPGGYGFDHRHERPVRFAKGSVRMFVQGPGITS